VLKKKKKKIKMNKEHDYITSDEDYDNQDDVIQIDSNKERFALFNISAQILDKNNIRDNIPAGTRLTVAKEQINCYADQINRTIKNNLLEKFMFFLIFWYIF
jgi:hypothetical protein